MARVLRLSACALAFCAIAAPAALADPPDVSVTISGIVERTHADTSGGARAITVLSTPTGPQAVTFDADQPVPPNGADVDLTGRLVGATLETDSVTITGPALAVPAGAAGSAQQATPVASGTPRTVAIVVITLGTVTPSYSDTDLQNVLVTNANSVSNYFFQQSYGAVSFRGINNAAGDVFHVTLSASSGCPWQSWGSQAATAAPAVNGYDNVIYVFNSQHQCGFAGVAWLPGREAFIDNAFTLPVVAHELGPQPRGASRRIPALRQVATRPLPSRTPTSPARPTSTATCGTSWGRPRGTSRTRSTSCSPAGSDASARAGQTITTKAATPPSPRFRGVERRRPAAVTTSPPARSLRAGPSKTLRSYVRARLPSAARQFSLHTCSPRRRARSRTACRSGSSRRRKSAIPTRTDS